MVATQSHKLKGPAGMDPRPLDHFLPSSDLVTAFPFQITISNVSFLPESNGQARPIALVRPLIDYEHIREARRFAD
jgi:hypothetical protein